MTPYERLDAWQLAHKLVLATYRVTEQFPAHERFGLISQARRSAFSIAANIVEGSARRGPKEFRRFLDISLGSLAELRYLFLVARDLEYIDEAEWRAIEEARDAVGRAVWGLYRKMSVAGMRKTSA